MGKSLVSCFFDSRCSANDQRNSVQPLVNHLLHQVLADLFPAGHEHFFRVMRTFRFVKFF